VKALAIPMEGRVVTACCGGHRPASDCPCCAECVTNADGGRLDPALRAVIAADEREIAGWLRPGYRRVVGVLEREALWDDLRQLERVTHSAIAAWCLTAEHDVVQAQSSRWFSRSGVLT
jgi:hypothetical protein